MTVEIWFYLQGKQSLDTKLNVHQGHISIHKFTRKPLKGWNKAEPIIRHGKKEYQSLHTLSFCVFCCCSTNLVVEHIFSAVSTFVDIIETDVVNLMVLCWFAFSPLSICRFHYNIKPNLISDYLYNLRLIHPVRVPKMSIEELVLAQKYCQLTGPVATISINLDRMQVLHSSPLTHIMLQASIWCVKSCGYTNKQKFKLVITPLNVRFTSSIYTNP